MLIGSEKQLAQTIATSLCKNAEDTAVVAENWEKIAKAILAHLVQNTQVIGVSPPNGGPIQGGRIA